jgi:delta 1-pyrroline-5-carboxylate dehydrogenase
MFALDGHDIALLAVACITGIPATIAAIAGLRNGDKADSVAKKVDDVAVGQSIVVKRVEDVATVQSATASKIDAVVQVQDDVAADTKEKLATIHELTNSRLTDALGQLAELKGIVARLLDGKNGHAKKDAEDAIC